MARYRGFGRAVHALVLARFVNVLGSEMAYPFATLYSYGELGIPFALVGVCAALAVGLLAPERTLTPAENGG